jgi:hypothetical protein
LLKICKVFRGLTRDGADFMTGLPLNLSLWWGPAPP